MTRRTFLSASTTMGITSSWVDALADLPQFKHADTKMPIKVLATNWGFNGTFEEFCIKAKGDGYDGFEVWVPATEKETETLVSTAQKHGLAFGFLAGASTANFEDHIKGYELAVRRAAAFKPLYVNTHAGRDYFSVEQNIRILSIGNSIASETRIPVLCETHRGRSAFSAPVTRQYMDAMSDLRLTADLSHWCVVHEGLLDGFEETLALALKRTHHIHARIGHAEGPQVNDPRAPEWANAVKVHLGWWDTVMAHAATEKRPFQTFLCEFGPPDYLPALPYTRQPVADQWAVNVYMMQVLRERYG